MSCSGENKADVCQALKNSVDMFVVGQLSAVLEKYNNIKSQTTLLFFMFIFSIAEIYNTLAKVYIQI